MMKISPFVLVSLLSIVDADSTTCAYLTAAPPVEYELPVSSIFGGNSLPLQFVGLTPTVIRKKIPAGSSPKITIAKYSASPSIQYDEVSGTVFISAEGCSAGPTSQSAAAATPYTSVCAGMAMIAAAATNQPLVGLASAVALLFPTANAQDDTCSHVVEVLVEAPAAYMGAVETCLAEVTDKSHCPSPFPTFPTCAEARPECKVAVVGAGAGSLYTALRMVDEGKVDGSDVCIFEMTERVGGRLFSLRGLGPDGDLTVDAGGYRTWPEFTPTVHALITEYLDIPMECYDPAQEPCQVFNIVDETGNKDGFATFVEEMMSRLTSKGACFFPQHELESITKIPADLQVASSALAVPTTELLFTNGVKATATFTTILGIPQRPLLNVLRNSNLPDTIVDTDTLDALHSVQTVIATKLYLYYPRGQLWWLKLGLTSGDFELEGDARNMLLGGRYHDGHIACDDDNDVDTCHGFLLAVYVNDLSGNKAQFFRRYQRERPEPVTILSESDLESAQFLSHAHDRLLEYHLYSNTNGNYTGSQANAAFRGVSPPPMAVLSTWSTAVPWAGGAWHSWTDLSNIDKAMAPLVDHNIFVVNEAYSLLHGWAEGSVKNADNMLSEYFDIDRPWSFTSTDLNQIVLQTNSAECVEQEDTGGGGNTVVVDDGSAAGVLCFTKDAVVKMADGTLQTIDLVREGDLVDTGTGHGKGVVTKTLQHPVHSIVPVAKRPTDDEVLVGTPDHPVLHSDGEWVEFAETTELAVEEMYIDVFYNLEIDGNEPGSSSHSYVVNGVVASGLGDGEELNRMFARQSMWKTTTE